MEAIVSSETRVTIYQSTRRNISQRLELHQYRCENLKYRRIYLVFMSNQRKILNIISTMVEALAFNSQKRQWNFPHSSLALCCSETWTHGSYMNKENTFERYRSSRDTPLFIARELFRNLSIYRAPRTKTEVSVLVTVLFIYLTTLLTAQSK